MSVSGNALVMREINTNLVRAALKAKREATKHDIAGATGLSTVTVANILQELVAAHEVFEAGLADSRGGRPAQLFRFNEDHAQALILFTHEQDNQDMLYLRVVNLYGETLHEFETALEDIDLHVFEPYVDAALEEYPAIKAIGFGLPGVELDGSIVAGDYPALISEAFLPHYQERSGLPAIFVNDVNAACVGYGRRTQIESEAAVVYLYFPQKYPPGAGITINGELYKGASNHAGEIADVPFGIDWRDPALYASPEQVGEAIARLIIFITRLMNPQNVVLYGGFIIADHLDIIQAECAWHISPRSMPDIRLTGDFTLDYQTGMIEETLALLEPQLSITL